MARYYTARPHRFKVTCRKSCWLTQDLNLAGTRSAFVELVGEYFPDDRLDAWEAMITEELAHKPGTESFTPLLTKIYADTVDRETDDLLDVDDDAIAISKIL